MGLFSFVGKALGSVGKLIPGVSNVINAVEMAGSLLGHKSGGSAAKYAAIQRVGPDRARGNTTQSGVGGYGGKMQILHGRLLNAQQLRASPVMPGGAVATARGPMAPSGGSPPSRYGGSAGKRRAAARRITGRKKKKSGGTKRRTRLKFGSPAWRKKYMKRRR